MWLCCRSPCKAAQGACGVLVLGKSGTWTHDLENLEEANGKRRLMARMIYAPVVLTREASNTILEPTRKEVQGKKSKPVKKDEMINRKNIPGKQLEFSRFY